MTALAALVKTIMTRTQAQLGAPLRFGPPEQPETAVYCPVIAHAKTSRRLVHEAGHAIPVAAPTPTPERLTHETDRTRPTAAHVQTSDSFALDFFDIIWQRAGKLGFSPKPGMLLEAQQQLLALPPPSIPLPPMDDALFWPTLRIVDTLARTRNTAPGDCPSPCAGIWLWQSCLLFCDTAQGLARFQKICQNLAALTVQNPAAARACAIACARCAYAYGQRGT